MYIFISIDNIFIQKEKQMYLAKLWLLNNITFFRKQNSQYWIVYVYRQVKLKLLKSHIFKQWQIFTAFQTIVPQQ